MIATSSASQPGGSVDQTLDEAPPSLFHLKAAVTSGMGGFHRFL
jgi:hypothetical protein